MVKCKFCGMESVDLTWKNIETNVNLPPKWKLYLGELPHKCSKKEKIPEKKVLCPKCNPETRKPMPASKLQEHIKTEHLGFW